MAEPSVCFPVFITPIEGWWHHGVHTVVLMSYSLHEQSCPLFLIWESCVFFFSVNSLLASFVCFSLGWLVSCVPLSTRLFVGDFAV